MNPTSAIHVVPLAMPEVDHGMALPRGDDWVQWLREHGLYEGFIQSLGGWMAAHAQYLSRPLSPTTRLRETQPIGWDGFQLHDVPHELHDRALMVIGSLTQPRGPDGRPPSHQTFQLLPARRMERSDPRRNTVQPDAIKAGHKSPIGTVLPPPVPTLAAPAPSRILRPERASVGVTDNPTPPSVWFVPLPNGPRAHTDDPKGEEDPLRPWRVQRIARFEGREPRPQPERSNPRKKRQR